MSSQFHQLGSDELGESLMDFLGESGRVTTADGVIRTVTMMVDRGEPNAVEPGARVRSYLITLRNSSSLGLTADEATQEANGDVPTATFARSAGDPPDLHITKPINRVSEQTGGMLIVEVMI